LNSGYRPQTATNFTFRFAKHFSAKDSKITHWEVLEWLLLRAKMSQNLRNVLNSYNISFHPQFLSMTIKCSRPEKFFKVKSTKTMAK
jgi:hypothetical protein